MNINRSNALQANRIAAIIYWTLSLSAFGYEFYTDQIQGVMHKYSLTTLVTMLINPVILVFYGLNLRYLLPNQNDKVERKPIDKFSVILGYTPIPLALFIVGFYTYVRISYY